MFSDEYVMTKKCQAAIRDGRREGFKEGFEEGYREEGIRLVKNMLADNMPVEKIAKYIGMSREQILKIAKDSEI